MYVVASENMPGRFPRSYKLIKPNVSSVPYPETSAYMGQIAVKKSKLDDVKKF